ncbi:DUF3055 domain-containing protein [Bacillus sp. Marseille-P3661]|uniref:DUF3055 domain-containing protein n=1 Tax=Bacillus sp. Marseille-P3661 TaxID=1936234 RepID=UPI000C84C262|nr:DUF3055 domain-containing protein [Bacillus sp. Marseille-P3661]
MVEIEKIYEEFENVKMHYVGFMTNDLRYDFAIIYTNMFLGKTLLTCMQTGRSTLIEGSDLEDPEHFCQIFNIDTDEAKTVTEFFKTKIPNSGFTRQY